MNHSPKASAGPHKSSANGVSSPSNRNAALKLEATGYWVIPLYQAGEKRSKKDPAKGKEPFGAGWGVKRRDAAFLDEHFRGFPGHGLGICFGPGRAPNGQWLIDLEGDGDRAARSLSIVLGSDQEPLTPAWDSRRGGHTIFALEESDALRLLALLTRAGATERIGAGGAGVYHLDALPDLEWRIGGYKADGAVKQVQSVVPPTVGENGVARTWRTLPSTKVAELPPSVFAALEALVEIATRNAKADGIKPGTNGRHDPIVINVPPRFDPVAAFGRKALQSEIDQFSQQGEGERHAYLLGATLKLASLVKAGALTEAECLAGLQDGARSNGMGPGRFGEIDDAWRSAYAMASARDLSHVGTQAGSAQPSANGTVPPCGGAKGDDERLAWFPHTDTGAAERMIARNGRNLRHCHPWKKWLHFDGRRWAMDDTAAVRRMAKATARKILAEASTVEDKDQRESLIKFARSTESRKCLAAMIDLAAAEDGVPVLPSELDVKPWLLNVENGTIDLETGKLRAHSRGDMITALAPVIFDPHAKCPLWDATLDRFFGKKEDLIAFWDRLCGIALTGDVSEQILPILYGMGDNGKSTMVGALLSILGKNYGAIAPANLLLAKRTEAHPTERAFLFGKRLVVTMETPEDARLNESLIKQLTGSDAITARRMNEDNWSFDPTHKLWMCTNHKPVVRGTDHAIWRRPKLVPFDVKIEDADKITDFPTQLRAEYPGILARMVRGCLDWKKNGLAVPQDVTDATAAYRDEQDSLSRFIDEECVKGSPHKVKAGVIYQAYREHTEHLGGEPISLTRFGLAMKERGFEKKTNNGIWYEGITLQRFSSLGKGNDNSGNDKAF